MKVYDPVLCMFVEKASTSAKRATDSATQYKGYLLLQSGYGWIVKDNKGQIVGQFATDSEARVHIDGLVKAKAMDADAWYLKASNGEVFVGPRAELLGYKKDLHAGGLKIVEFRKATRQEAGN